MLKAPPTPENANRQDNIEFVLKGPLIPPINECTHPSDEDLDKFEPLDMRHLPLILSKATDTLVPPLMYYGIPIPEDDGINFVENLAKEVKSRGKTGTVLIQMVYGLTEDQAPGGSIVALEGNLGELDNSQEFIDSVVNILRLGPPKWYLSFDAPFYTISW